MNSSGGVAPAVLSSSSRPMHTCARRTCVMLAVWSGCGAMSKPALELSSVSHANTLVRLCSQRKWIVKDVWTGVGTGDLLSVGGILRHSLEPTASDLEVMEPSPPIAVV